MKLDKINAISIESLEPSLHGTDRGSSDIGDSICVQTNLGRNDGRSTELVQYPSQILLGLSQAVGEGRIEESDSEIQGTLDGLPLIFVGRLYHEHSVIAAAEADLGNLNPCLAEYAIPHRFTSFWMIKDWKVCSSPPVYQ
jgi:hypothetical protein